LVREPQVAPAGQLLDERGVAGRVHGLGLAGRLG
jgi:hypothetical protein